MWVQGTEKVEKRIYSVLNQSRIISQSQIVFSYNRTIALSLCVDCYASPLFTVQLLLHEATQKTPSYCLLQPLHEQSQTSSLS